MIHATCYGRLSRDPEARTTKSGSAMVTASLAVDVTGRDGEPETLWLNVLAFGTAAEVMQKAIKGEVVSVMGRVTRGRYSAKDGTERESWTLVADSVITARSSRPNTGKRQQTKPRVETPAPFDDDLSF